MTALIKVGVPEFIASSTADFNSVGDETLTPTPPKASINLSYLESFTNTVVATSSPSVGFTSTPRYIPPLLNTTTHTGNLYLHIVSISMAEKPNALSPSIAKTEFPVSTVDAIAEPIPIPITPQVPTSILFLG